MRSGGNFTRVEELIMNLATQVQILSTGILVPPTIPQYDDLELVEEENNEHLKEDYPTRRVNPRSTHRHNYLRMHESPHESSK